MSRRERSEITRRLPGVVDNLNDVIGLQRQLGFLQTGYRYSVQILPAVATAPLCFRGQIELGGATQSFGAFSHTLGDFSLIVTRYDSPTQFVKLLFLETITGGATGAEKLRYLN